MALTPVDPTTNREPGEHEYEVHQPAMWRCDCGALLFKRELKTHVCPSQDANDVATQRREPQ